MTFFENHVRSKNKSFTDYNEYCDVKINVIQQVFLFESSFLLPSVFID